MAQGNGSGSGQPVWAAIAGLWRFEHTGVVYRGREEAATIPYGLALSNASLRDGRVAVKIRFTRVGDGMPASSSGGVVLGYQSESANYLVIQIGGHGAAYSISSFLPARGWHPLETAGAYQNLEPGKDYLLEVTQRGQDIRMSVDGVRILQHVAASPWPGNQLGLYAYGEPEVSFTATRFSSSANASWRSLTPEPSRSGLSACCLSAARDPGRAPQEDRARQACHPRLP